jgi:hypothetical protein
MGLLFIASITSDAAHTHQTWPYVVIPDFVVAAEKLRSLCGAVYVNTRLLQYCPSVSTGAT